MLKGIEKGTLIILSILVIYSLFPLAAAAEPPALAKLSGAEKARIAKLIEGTKKEGKLIGYASGLRPDVQEDMFRKFRDWYGLTAADLEINVVSTRTDTIALKVTEELRANVYRTDVIQNAAIDWFNDLAPIFAEL